MAHRFLVYGLIDPRDGQLRYVGKSCSGLKRPRSHCYPGVMRRSRSHCGNWVKNLAAVGLKPGIEVLEARESPDGLSEAEQFYIAYFRSLGCNLTNITAGGEGQLGVKFSAERKLKIGMGHNGLTEEEQREVVELYVAGETTRALALRFDMGVSSIWYVLHRRGVRLRTKSEAAEIRRARRSVVSNPIKRAA